MYSSQDFDSGNEGVAVNKRYIVDIIDGILVYQFASEVDMEFHTNHEELPKGDELFRGFDIKSQPSTVLMDFFNNYRMTESRRNMLHISTDPQSENAATDPPTSGAAKSSINENVHKEEHQLQMVAPSVTQLSLCSRCGNCREKYLSSATEVIILDSDEEEENKKLEVVDSLDSDEEEENKKLEVVDSLDRDEEEENKKLEVVDEAPSQSSIVITASWSLSSEHNYAVTQIKSSLFKFSDNNKNYLTDNGTTINSSPIHAVNTKNPCSSKQSIRNEKHTILSTTIRNVVSNVPMCVNGRKTHGELNNMSHMYTPSVRDDEVIWLDNNKHYLTDNDTTINSSPIHAVNTKNPCSSKQSIRNEKHTILSTTIRNVVSNVPMCGNGRKTHGELNNMSHIYTPSVRDDEVILLDDDSEYPLEVTTPKALDTVGISAVFKPVEPDIAGVNINIRQENKCIIPSKQSRRKQTLSAYKEVNSQDYFALKPHTIICDVPMTPRNKTSVPTLRPMVQQSLLNSNSRFTKKKFRKGTPVVHIQKQTQDRALPAFALTCLTPGIGYIALEEFEPSIIKVCDPFDPPGSRYFTCVSMATKWLNYKLREYLEFEDGVELKWLVANSVMLERKKIKRFDWNVLFDPRCRITKHGVIFI